MPKTEHSSIGLRGTPFGALHGQRPALCHAQRQLCRGAAASQAASGCVPTGLGMSCLFFCPFAPVQAAVGGSLRILRGGILRGCALGGPFVACLAGVERLPAVPVQGHFLRQEGAGRRGSARVWLRAKE